MSVKQINALIIFYLHINPTELSDNDWANAWSNLQFALKFDGERYRDASALKGLQ